MFINVYEKIDYVKNYNSITYFNVIKEWHPFAHVAINYQLQR